MPPLPGHVVVVMATVGGLSRQSINIVLMRGCTTAPRSCQLMLPSHISHTLSNNNILCRLVPYGIMIRLMDWACVLGTNTIIASAYRSACLVRCLSFTDDAPICNSRPRFDVVHVCVLPWSGRHGHALDGLMCMLVYFYQPLVLSTLFVVQSGPW